MLAVFSSRWSNSTEEPTTGPTLPGLPGSGGQQIAYEVTGEGTATIVFSDAAGVQREDNTTLPWRREFTAPQGMTLATLTATRTGAAGGDLTCRIVVDGQEEAENTGGTFSALCFTTLF